jgi:predicted nucleotidyltransferase
MPKENPMRLNPRAVTLLTTALYRLDPHARLFLFGSRTDDRAHGGDIDLLILSRTLRPRDVRPLRLAFFREFGEQKLDILIDDGSLRTPFVRRIFPQATELT